MHNIFPRETLFNTSRKACQFCPRFEECWAHWRIADITTDTSLSFTEMSFNQDFMLVFITEKKCKGKLIFTWKTSFHNYILLAKERKAKSASRIRVDDNKLSCKIWQIQGQPDSGVPIRVKSYNHLSNYTICIHYSCSCLFIWYVYIRYHNMSIIYHFYDGSITWYHYDVR